jgi:hypothetical protein
MSHYVHNCPDIKVTGQLCARCSHIAELVKSWPPLTDEQVDILRRLLPPVEKAPSEK